MSLKKEVKKLSKQVRAEGSVVKREEVDGKREITIQWSTGYKGLRSNWDGTKYYEELGMSEQECDLTRLNSGRANILSQHDNNIFTALGVITKAWIEDGKGYCTARFSKREELQGIIGDIDDGILNNVSVSYKTYEYTQVSNEETEIPTLRATKWEPLEVSFVGIGFDPEAYVSARSAEVENDVTIVTQVKEKTEEELAEEARIAADETAKAEAAKAEADALEAQKLADEKEVERKEKETTVRNMVLAAGLDEKLVEEFMSREATIEEISKDIFDKVENKNKVTKHVQRENKMELKDKLVEALLNRIDSKRFKVSEGNEYRSVSLIEAGQALMKEAGKNPDDFNKGKLSRAVIVSSGLPKILENVANKLKLDVMPAGVTYDKWTVGQSIRDFKPTSILMFSASGLQAKVEGEDYEDGSLAESKETITLEERGVLFQISQKAIINDDLGFLKDLPAKGYAAGYRDIDNRVYALLQSNAGMGPTMSDTKTLFHADHLNSITADGKGPSVEGIAAANLLFANMTDDAGHNLGLRTKVILCPPALELQAKQTVGAIFPTENGKVNPYAGELEVVVSSKLTNPDVWYAVADKSLIPSIVYGTLEGFSEPSVSSNEEFTSSNAQLKVEFPNGVAAATYKSIIKTIVDEVE